jgi:hypothetical protein
VGNPVTPVAEADRLDIVEIPIEVPTVRHHPFLDGGFGDSLGDAVGLLECRQLIVLVRAPSGRRWVSATCLRCHDDEHE